MADTLTKTVNIRTSPERVWEYLNDLSKWPEWAIHNVFSASPGPDGYWHMKGPRGTQHVKMMSHKALGILDQEFNDPVEGNWLVPCRVVAGNEGAHFMMSFTKPAEMPEEPFYQAVALIEQEMAKLKEILEDAQS
ncbi:SRPBCC family protein [Hymenobacter negativus]|uniref:SRPBCC family protein n=1 Tax=Hymenobacter negativus TaxID=2795026 RepID=A0ABS3Q8Z1_9BACT|nr:SRPBCC family protein [Hymenobacter negativus]MBO2007596.1 SRPBCC family protein [Hymenobacter negativus]